MARVGVVLGIAVFGFFSTARSQDCPEYAGVMEVEMWSSSPSQVQISGSYAYLGGPSFLSITDVTDLEGPRVVGRIPGDVTDLSVSGNRLFFISEWCGGKFPQGPMCFRKFHIADVSDPERPEPLLAGYPLESSPREIAVSDNTVFIASAGGLLVLDVTDPSSPIEEGFLDSPWEPSGLEVEGGFAYVAVPESGLRIIDVSDPANPLEVGSWEETWEALDLEVSGGFAYVADGSGGLRVIDVTNPDDPTEIGILETEFEALSVSVDRSLATVGLAHPGLLIVDVSDPANPKRKSLFVTEGPAEDVALSGSTAFALNGELGPSVVGGFHVLDLSNPESPAELSSFDFRSQVMDVVVSNGVTYVASGDSGLYVLDESNPDEVVQGFLDTPGFALGVTLHNGLALVADDHKGLRIIDVTDPANLVEVGFVDTPGQARRVTAAGDHAYVADGDGGLRIVDISMPATPVEVRSIDTPGPAVDVAVIGDYAYVADGHLRIVGVSEPTQPIEIPTPEPMRATVLAIDGFWLFAAFPGRLQTVDIGKLRDPQILATHRLYGEPSEIELSDDHAYVATRRENSEELAGMEIFDILIPSFPSRAGGWEFEGDAWGVAVSNGRVYLAGGQPEVVILDTRCLTTYWVEIVAHDRGLRGSQWRSDVIINHEAERGVPIDFILHTADGQFNARAYVGKGQQGVFEDIVGLLGYEGKGALEIQASHPITISSRIYSEADPGTYGAFLQGYRSSGCSGSGALYGLRQVEGEFRTNISVTNTTAETREVWIKLYRTDGKELIGYSVEVESGMVVQDVQPFKNRAGQPNLGWGYATVDGGKGILACASVIDSRTNDALIVPLTR